MTTYFGGLISGLGLIVAIGAQNAHVLRQGMMRSHVGLVVALCVGSDALLISAGVYGLGALLARCPTLSALISLGGIGFLWYYGLQAARRAMQSTSRLTKAGTAPPSRRRVALSTLALTWLNPHVYIDTILLLGALAQAHPAKRTAFAAGAITASLLFFALLGYGARAAAPWLASPRVWRVLDAGIALIMFWAGTRLALMF